MPIRNPTKQPDSSDLLVDLNSPVKIGNQQHSHAIKRIPPIILISCNACTLVHHAHYNMGFLCFTYFVGCILKSVERKVLIKRFIVFAWLGAGFFRNIWRRCGEGSFENI